MKIGVHVSIKGSIDLAVDRANSIFCDTFQIFTRNPRGWRAKELDENVVILFKEKIAKFSLEPIFAHIPYLVNLASFDDDLWNKSLLMINEELQRCDKLGILYLITHLGSIKGKRKEIGMKKVKNTINVIFDDYIGKTRLLLENTAGSANSLGSNLVDIFNIINSVNYPEHIGLCFDTCHAFASGYDLREVDVINEITYSIKKAIGIKRLKCIHCNDSLFDLGEGRDRHEHIGLGKIGRKGFLNIINNDYLKAVPLICETPVDNRRDDKGNLNYLRQLKE